MTFDEYQKAALRTASMGLGPQIEMCVRTLGLCGELIELKESLGGAAEELLKEGGDVLWYAVTLADMFQLNGARLGVIDLDDFDMVHFSGSRYDTVDRAIEAAGRLAELVKKQVGHGKPADVIKVGVQLQIIVSAVNTVMPWELGVVARANIDKLKARYPEGFSKAIASVKPDSDDNAGRLGHTAPWKPGPV